MTPLLRRARGSLLITYLRISDFNIIRELSAQLAGAIREFFNLARVSSLPRLPVKHWVIDVPSILDVM